MDAVRKAMVICDQFEGGSGGRVLSFVLPGQCPQVHQKVGSVTIGS